MENKGNKKTTTTTTTTTTVVEETLKKTGPSVTYYKFVLDRSGSMASIQKDTVDSFNEQIGKLKRIREEFPNQKYLVSLVIFDDIIETVIEDKLVEEIDLLSYDSYMPRGTTALHDAIGMTIQKTKESTGKLLTENENTHECMIVVLTDGYENASKEYNQNSLSPLLKEANEKSNWTVMFIGANEQSVVNARSLGFAGGNTSMANYTSDGINIANAAMSNVLYRDAYAKSKGVKLKSTSRMSSVNDSWGFASSTLNLQDIDDAAENLDEDTGE